MSKRRIVRGPRFAVNSDRPRRHGRLSRICVAVDATDAADNAANLAISLVRCNDDAELDFCHVINTQRMLAYYDRSLDDYGFSFELAQEAAHVVLARCALLAQNAGVFARTYVRFGNPATEAEAFARGRGADLVVIGNRPAQKIHRLLNGSIRDEMVRTCPLPLLVAANVTRCSADFNPRCIVVAGADSPQASGAKRIAAELAADYVSRLILLPSAAGGETSTQKHEIHAAIREHAPGLIVMACARRRRVRNFFVDDVVERVLQEAQVPLLVVGTDELRDGRSR